MTEPKPPTTHNIEMYVKQAKKKEKTVGHEKFSFQVALFSCLSTFATVVPVVQEEAWLLNLRSSVKL